MDVHVTRKATRGFVVNSFAGKMLLKPLMDEPEKVRRRKKAKSAKQARKRNR